MKLCFLFFNYTSKKKKSKKKEETRKGPLLSDLRYRETPPAIISNYFVKV